MTKDVRTHSYATKRGLPAREGNPKVCNRCELWFLAGPRQRVCEACHTNQERTLHALKSALAEGEKLRNPVSGDILWVAYFNSIKPQVRACAELAFQTASEEQFEWVSQACKYPKQPQAEHLPSARQHPYAGDRPEESGWCTGACNCTCHIKVYEGLVT